jgi:iron complex outermembrane receptor protein
MKYFYLLCVGFICIVTYGQKNEADTCHYIFKGRLLYSNDSSAVDGAYIYHHHLNHFVFSDSLGYFQFSGLCKGLHILHVNHVGMMHQDLSINIPQLEQVAVFYLDGLTHTNEIIVHGEIPNTSSSEGSYSNTLEGESLQNAQGETLGQMLTKLPGVNALQTGPTIFKPMVQGMYGSRLLIINHSVRQEGQQWGSEHAPEIDPFTAGRIEVIRGAQSLRYGPDAMGGVILIEPKKLRLDSGTEGSLTMGATSYNRGYHLASSITHRLKKIPSLAFALQGSFKQGGNVRTPHYWLENTGLKELNGSATIDYHWNAWNVHLYSSRYSTRLGIFTGSHIGNTTDLINAINAPQPQTPSYFSYQIGNPYQEVLHDLSTIKISKKIHAHHKVTVQYARQYDERKEYDAHGYTNNTSALNLKLTTHGLQTYWDHRTSEKLHGSVGMMYQFQKNTYEGRYFIPNYESHLIGIYAYETWHMHSKWAVEAGLRYDVKNLQSYFYQQNQLQSPYRTFNNISYSIGLHHSYSKSGNIKILLASAFRAPHASELYSNGVHHGSAAVEIGNAELSAEKGINTSLYIDKVFNQLTCYAYGSVYWFDNYIYLAPVFPPSLTIRGAFPTFKYTQVKANYYSVDLGIKDTLSKNFYMESSISMVQAYDQSQKQWLINIPATQFIFQLEYQPLMIKKMQPSLYVTFNQVFKKTNAPDTDYAPAPNGYQLINLGLKLRPKIQQQQLLITFDVTNVLNTSYRNYTDRMRYYNDAVGRSFNLKIYIPINQ